MIETERVYTYNKEGRLYKIAHKGRQKEQEIANTYTYDGRGNIIKAHALHGRSVTRSYNAFDEMTSETIKEDGEAYTVFYTYDQRGRVKTIRLPDRSSIDYTYEALHGKSVTRYSPSGEKLYEHEYLAFDTQGNCLEEKTLLGKKERAWTPSGQPRKNSCPFFQESVPPFGYDASGQLLFVQREGVFAPNDLAYSYNLLQQVTEEKGDVSHTYTYDTLGNRVSKNAERYTLDDLNQLRATSSVEYTYTESGHLLTQKKGMSFWQVTSNCLGQLVNIHKEDKTLLTYAYDPFGRRISTKQFDVSKRTKRKLSSSKFLYFGQLEVGRFDDKGELVELRIPGISKDSLGDESIAFELNRCVIVPIYDLKGNVVAIVDPDAKEVLEVYTYSAYGELTCFSPDGEPRLSSNMQSPWGYQGRRHDVETGYLLLGHRFYDPSIGRWLTPDPALFTDGPHLYQFTRNNPLRFIDPFGLASELNYSQEIEEYLYGEYETHCFCERHRTCKRGGHLKELYGQEVFRITFKESFEASYDNISHLYEVSEEGTFQELAKGRIQFINGINTTEEFAKSHASYLSRLSGGYKIHGVYNATHGCCTDAYEYVLNLDFHATTPIKELHKSWNAYFAKSNTPLLQICHSQGACQVRNALMCYPKELREKIIVVAIAPGAYIQKGLCKEVTHYVTKWNRDVVPWLDLPGRLENKESIIVLTPHEKAARFDHDFQSPTYEKSLSDQISKYINKYGG